MASITGTQVDRPPVCFYELNGLDEDPNDSDQYNVFNNLTWLPLIELTREQTDRIVMRSTPFPSMQNQGRVTTTVTDHPGHRTTVTTMVAGGRKVPERVLTSVSLRRPEANTIWVTEHLLKSNDDVLAYLDTPTPEDVGEPDTSGVLQTEAMLGDTGIVMIDTGDPICAAASLFDFETYCITAMTENALFRRLLDHFAATLYEKIDRISRALPGRLWRIYGPEYASPPYLPPSLFDEYVAQYDKPMIDLILRDGGFPRIHSHGNLAKIIESIAGMGATGLDPIEPPSQGDVHLKDIRERYGDKMTLFGNIEVSEIETLDAGAFARRAQNAVSEGTHGEGRGFVLMPSACPCGRELSTTALKNYETLVEVVQTA